MPVRIRFTGPATLNATITISWAGGYPPGATASAMETFKTVRVSPWQTTIATDPTAQAIAYFAALTQDYSVNFVITRVGNDVIINPKNGTPNVTATTTSSNIIINPSVSQVTLLTEPQKLTPAYNPVTFKFFSANYSIPGQRYLVNVYKDYGESTQETVAKFKIAPQIDGTGYVDVSKQLSNFLTVNFDPTTTALGTQIADTTNSYIKYAVGIGEEFQTNWLFQGVTGATGTNAGKAKLTQTPNLTAHTYVVNDQINITTDFPVGSVGKSVEGLHTVLEVPNAYSVVIDTTWTAGGTATNGLISYADGRKTAYNDVVVADELFAFNGARSWVDLPNWDWQHWFIQQYVYQSPDCELLTSLRINSETGDNNDNHFYMKPSQTLWLNTIMDLPSPDEWYVEWDATNADGSLSYESGAFQLSPASYNVKQVIINPNELIGTSTNYDLIDRIFFRVIDSAYEAVTRFYSVWLDKRCTIEDTEIYFMDRMGSILSFACQLKEKESGTITREQFKQNVSYNETSTSYADIYDQWDRGSKVTSVNVEKEIELNTNWMNNEMSLLFDELLTSPYTWIKQILPATNELPERTTYLACVVKETSFQVERQKNKRLIRKTFTVKLANENIINI